MSLDCVCCQPDRNNAKLAEEVLERCKQAGLRSTKGLKEIINSMLDDCQPVSLADLSNRQAVAGSCDRATVFRILKRLCEAGIARRLGLNQRSFHFILVLPGCHHDYLICGNCGSIKPLELPCPVSALEKQLQQNCGFQCQHHELSFYGLCANCR